MEIDIDTNSIGQNFVKLNNIVDDMLSSKLNIFEDYVSSNSLSYSFISFNLKYFLINKEEKVFVAYGNIVKTHQNSYNITINENFFIYTDKDLIFESILNQIKERNYLLTLRDIENIMFLKETISEEQGKETKIKAFIMIFHYCMMLYCSFFSKYKFNIHDKILIINSENKCESIILTKILQLFGLKVFLSVNSIYNKDEIFNEFKNNEVLFNEDINTLSTHKEFVLGVNFIFDFQKTFVNDRTIIYTLLSEGGTTIIFGQDKDIFQLDPHDVLLFYRKNLSIQFVNVEKFSENFLKKGSLLNFLSNILVDLQSDLTSLLMKLDNYQEKRINNTEEFDENLSSFKFILNIVNN